MKYTKKLATAIVLLTNQSTCQEVDDFNTWKSQL